MIPNLWATLAWTAMIFVLLVWYLPGWIRILARKRKKRVRSSTPLVEFDAAALIRDNVQLTGHARLETPESDHEERPCSRPHIWFDETRESCSCGWPDNQA